MAQNVLVIGAGELGLAVIEALVSHPLKEDAKISVLLRQSTLDSGAPEKLKFVQQLRGQGLGFEAGDVAKTTEAELSSIFTKYDTVICCSGMGLPSGSQTKLARAILAADGVKRYFPWQFGMDYDTIGAGSSQDLFDEQLEVRKMLRGQTQKEWVIVSTGVFTSFIFLAAFGVVDLENKTVRALGSWENRITATTPNDIGRVTAEIVLDPKGIKGGQVVFVAGDTVSYGGLADTVDDHFGTEMKREMWDLKELRRQMEEEPSVMVKYRDTFAQGRGVAWDKEGTINHARGMKMMDVRGYIESSGLTLGE